jgi:hypothetical protein
MSFHFFDSMDALQFLNPKIYYVGACFNRSICQLERFFNESMWENGFIDYLKENPSERTDKMTDYEKYMDGVRKGDVFLAKRLNGVGATTMRILAIGIVLGKNYNRTIRVAWVMQDLSLEVPLAWIGTISPGYDISEILDKVLVDKLNKARAKFLRLNLQIKDQYY